jgi:hypothetical protein
VTGDDLADDRARRRRAVAFGGVDLGKEPALQFRKAERSLSVDVPG